MRTTSPCLDCHKHGIDIYCHAKCIENGTFEAEKQARYAQQQTDYAIRDVHIQAVLRAEKKKHLAYG